MTESSPRPAARHVTVGGGRIASVAFGNDLPLALIAGPCALESRAHALETAQALKEIAGRLGIGLVYKTSFDKANRSSANWSYVTTVHGPGLYVAFSGPVSLDAHVRVLAPFGSHPDGDVPLQEGNGSLWQVWIEYLGTGSIDVNFQYGYGYTINGALVYIGTLTPGWASYGLIPAP